MALLLPNNKYLKIININGEYVIYENAENRNTNKTAPKPAEVLKKYSDIITKMLSDRERQYYDPNFITEIQTWIDEATLYKKSATNGDTSTEFPLMKKYIKNIKKTIPVIVSVGKFRFEAESIKEIYEKIKQYEIFGTTEEVKDV